MIISKINDVVFDASLKELQANSNVYVSNAEYKRNNKQMLGLSFANLIGIKKQGKSTLDKNYKISTAVIKVLNKNYSTNPAFHFVAFFRHVARRLYEVKLKEIPSNIHIFICTDVHICYYLILDDVSKIGMFFTLRYNYTTMCSNILIGVSNSIVFNDLSDVKHIYNNITPLLNKYLFGRYLYKSMYTVQSSSKSGYPISILLGGVVKGELKGSYIGFLNENTNKLNKLLGLKPLIIDGLNGLYIIGFDNIRDETLKENKKEDADLCRT